MHLLNQSPKSSNPPKARACVNTAEVVIYSWGDKLSGVPMPSPKYFIPVHEWRNPQTHGPFRSLASVAFNSSVLKWMEDDPRVGVLSRELYRLSEMALRAQKETYISYCIVDHYGRWIAPAIAEIIANDLENHFTVAVDHAYLKVQ